MKEPCADYGREMILFSWLDVHDSRALKAQKVMTRGIVSPPLAQIPPPGIWEEEEKDHELDPDLIRAFLTDDRLLLVRFCAPWGQAWHRLLGRPGIRRPCGQSGRALHLWRNAASMNHTEPPALVFALFPFIFIGGWCLVMLLLSRMGGWSRLAERFPGRDRQPSGRRFSGQSGRAGLVNYNGCLTIHTSAEGLHLAVWPIFRLGHPPLFIPWDEIHHTKLKRFLWFRWVAFEVGAPKVTTLQLSEKVFEGYKVVETR